MSVATLENRKDLMHFLRVVRPDWSCPRKHGHSDVHRVVEKLTAMGVGDTSELLKRVLSNKLNEDLSRAGYPRLSRETMDAIRKHGSFFRVLENLTEVTCRGIGEKAAVTQLLRRSSPGNRPRSPSKSHSRSCGRLPTQLPPRVVDAVVDVTGLAVPEALVVPKLRGAKGRPREAWQDQGAVAAATPAATANGRRQSRCSVTESVPYSLCSRVTSPQCSPRANSRMSLSTSWRTQNLEAAEANKLEPLPASGPQEEAKLQRKAEALVQMGANMQANLRPACWKVLRQGSKSTLADNGEAMLQEQAAVDERLKLLKQFEREGLVSPMRKYVAENVKSRFAMHQTNPEREGVEVQHRCVNIRKHITLMANARRELGVLRKSLEDGH